MRVVAGEGDVAEGEVGQLAHLGVERERGQRDFGFDGCAGPRVFAVDDRFSGEVREFFGAFFFGAADKLESALHRTGELPPVLILRMRDVLALDATGLDALEDLLEKLRQQRKHLILCGPHSQPLFALTRSGFIEKLGMENICGDMDASLVRAEKVLAGPGS